VVVMGKPKHTKPETQQPAPQDDIPESSEFEEGEQEEILSQYEEEQSGQQPTFEQVKPVEMPDVVQKAVDAFIAEAEIFVTWSRPGNVVYLTQITKERTKNNVPVLHFKQAIRGNWYRAKCTGYQALLSGIDNLLKKDPATNLFRIEYLGTKPSNNPDPSRTGKMFKSFVVKGKTVKGL
jgi:hypothetical protein